MKSWINWNNSIEFLSLDMKGMGNKTWILPKPDFLRYTVYSTGGSGMISGSFSYYPVVKIFILPELALNVSMCKEHLFLFVCVCVCICCCCVYHMFLSFLSPACRRTAALTKVIYTTKNHNKDHSSWTKSDHSICNYYYIF